MTLDQIAAVTGGQVVDASAVVEVAGEAFVDSRRVVPGGLFVAVKGERVDGHDFAARAVAGGAAAALVSRPVGVPAVVVEDTVSALGQLARHVVAQLPDLVVVGITGSQGKTGSKDALAQILEAHGPTVATAGNFNNEIGVPLTALQVTGDTRYLVAEMGARGHGHISYLASLVSPRAGLVLNVGVAHLSEFGSRADIARAKGELVEVLPPTGLAVLNADDDLVAAMRSRTPARVLTYGEGADADVRIEGLTTDDEGRPRFTLAFGQERAAVSLPLVGEHQASNAAGAAAVALGLGLPLRSVAAALDRLEPRSRWRMEVTTTPDRITVINDAYNANPDSMRAALTTLVELGRRRGSRTVAVLGEMGELGPTSPDKHDELGRLAASLGVSLLVVVGDGARRIHLGASSGDRWAGESVPVPEVDDAIAFLRGALRPGDVVLVKASRAAGLEVVAEALAGGERVRG
jgi:UDP-N-acetylmuramoyl-tripeptide--D-alanyl-D-alanine ligase